jgi:lipoprotein-anchoring transpeptidase ErfK/SrfK
MRQRLAKPLILALGLLAVLSFSNCAPQPDHCNKMIVSVRDQKMVLMRDNQPVKTYKISTSKFGLGDSPRSNCTPIGHMQVAKKIGDGQPAGAVFKSRRPTGEVIKPNAPGRDPIVSRILWLKGKERHNRNAFNRFIYIHGTPEVNRLGTPVSYGCIRMGTKDVIDLYNRVGTGADIYVVRGSLGNMVAERNLVAR